MGKFKDKIVLITGAAAGIGRETALAFAHEGATVVAADINAAEGAATAHIIKGVGNRCRFIQADVANSADVAALFDELLGRYGRLDIAFNNAGVEGQITRTADAAEADFDRIFAVNVKGVWLCMQREIRQMVAQGGGVIVNIASVAGLVGAHSMPLYAASKHAVVGLTKSAAVEYARKGVRINAVCPYLTQTGMVERAFEQVPALEQSVMASAPMRRIGQAAEVAAAVLWLASDAASYINGVALPIDGGFTAQ